MTGRERRAHHRRQARALAAEDGARAARWVAEYTEQHHCGPTWSELVTAMGWQVSGMFPDVLRYVTVRWLERLGWLLVDEHGKRSLRPGPALDVTAAPDASA